MKLYLFYSRLHWGLIWLWRVLNRKRNWGEELRCQDSNSLPLPLVWLSQFQVPDCRAIPCSLYVGFAKLCLSQPLPQGMGGGSCHSIVSCAILVTQELERHRVPFAEPGAGRASPMTSDTLIAQAPEKVAGNSCPVCSGFLWKTDKTRATVNTFKAVYYFFSRTLKTK